MLQPIASNNSFSVDNIIVVDSPVVICIVNSSTVASGLTMVSCVSLSVW